MSTITTITEVGCFRVIIEETQRFDILKSWFHSCLFASDSNFSLLSFTCREDKKIVYKEGVSERHGVKLKLINDLSHFIYQHGAIPIDFLASEEAYREQLEKKVFAGMLFHDVLEKLVRGISETIEMIRDDQRGGYFTVEVRVRKVMKYTVMVATEECICKEPKEKDCAICLKELSGVVSCINLECCHVFHRDCVMLWLKRHQPSCPLCRRHIKFGLELEPKTEVV